jgi:hypothetical protein
MVCCFSCAGVPAVKKSFGGIYHLHFHSGFVHGLFLDFDDGGKMFHEKLDDYMALHPRRLNSVSLLH